MAPETQPPNPAAGPSKFWMAVRILNVRLRFIFLMVLVGVVASQWDNLMNHWERWRRPQHATATAAEEIEFFCPMHPSVVRDAPGNCPICGMPLSKRPKTGERVLPPGVLGQVELSPLKVAMGRIGTSPVEYRLLAREVRTVGTVDYDETRRAFITSRVKGRIDKLFVNYTGQTVKKDDPLVSIYSPDLLVAQQELLSAVRMREQQKDASEAVKANAQAVLDSTRQKLILWGLTEAQVDEIIRRGTADTHVTVRSPIAGIITDKKALEGLYVAEGDALYTIADLSDVWMQAQIFESDIGGIQVGTAAEVTTTAYPNEIFAGRITFVAYTVDPATRTVAARLEIDNQDYKLKPGMYANVTIRLPVGQVIPIDFTSKPAEAAATTRVTDTGGLVKAYLSLAAAFAADKTDDAAAGSIATEAEKLSRLGDATFREQASAIAKAAAAMKGESLKGQRETFKTLSAKIIDLLAGNPPRDMKLFVVHCPMADADWLSTAPEVINPYYGSDMLNCGTVTGPLKPRSRGEPGIVNEQRFSMGYYCPIEPDRLYNEPMECPIDKFPMKYAKVEKVLAVPESAVIDTGLRKIVYRESTPSVFDMLEVKLGAKAGEFFPVLEGLSDGDKVATAGAFLVDAENRLNPAASVQYFGATGAPHQH
ncbi:MAG TPA: efflux RND transporter periplasmic adaptor subunit [Phycisphaerae bacterium]|nr:efflux RND transporter periplasmic adaptor subunit [Phycisphaerae bacterium]